MRKQRGVVLVISMIFLLLLTMIGVTAMQTTVLEEKMAGNFQDQTIALAEAENGTRVAADDVNANFDFIKNEVETSGEYSVAWSEPGYYASFEYRISDGDIIEIEDKLEAVRVYSVGTTTTNARREVKVWLNRPIVPVDINSALSLHATGQVDLFGTPKIDGHDHDVPNDFDCNGAACNGSLAVPAEDAIGVYSENAPDSLNTTGASQIDGDPATQVDGAPYDSDFWRDYVEKIEPFATERNGSNFGTRDDPVIHVIDQDMMIGGNTDGAGILIIKDVENLVFTGNFHFEGLVIMLSEPGTPLNLSFQGTVDIFGSVATVGTDINVDLFGTADIKWSAIAIQNLGKLEEFKRVAWSEVLP